MYSEEHYTQGGNPQGARRADGAEVGAQQRPTGSRGKVTSRPSRDSILQSYAAQDAERARNARMYSQAVSQVYQESASRAQVRAAQRAELEAHRREREVELAAQRAAREASRAAEREAEAQRQGMQTQAGRVARPRTRVVPPLSTQESYDRTRSSMEGYERARAQRDALSESRRARAGNREVIDARGSIDSRAFNEQGELVGYSADDRDRPRAAVDDSFTSTRWHSRAGQGFSDVPDSGSAHRGSQRAPRQGGVGFSGGVMSGRAQYAAPRSGLMGLWAGLPLVVKIAVPVIVVLVIVLVFLLTR
ncbi:hypothetical protein [Adlercreutzia sp. ZJ305]|nr:hypothetical protein [Adlercreutzia sp. ZJ305]